MMPITAHLARHLEEIALTVLPTSPESEEGTENDSRLSSTDGSQREDLAEPSAAAELEAQAFPDEYISSLFKKHILLPLSQQREIILLWPCLLKLRVE